VDANETDLEELVTVLATRIFGTMPLGTGGVPVGEVEQVRNLGQRLCSCSGKLHTA